MERFFDVLLDSLIDSAKILPILLLVYFLIEFFEHKQASKFESMKFINKKNAPMIGSLFGSLPQCGFSVVATDLYNKRKVTIGALIAVYIATSDEALPVMLSQPSSYKAIIPLLFVKIVIAIIVGYISQLLFDVILKTEISNKDSIVDSEEHEHSDEDEHNEAVTHHGCCHHDIEHNKYDWKHPLLHCVKIIGTIFVINVLLGCIIEFGFHGEEQLAEFLTKNSIYALQPLLAMLIGFIPNCASSVVLTELYLIGGLSFGSLCAGLIVNAGLGLILLFKGNKKVKENIFIITTLVITSLSFGYLLHYIL